MPLTLTLVLSGITDINYLENDIQMTAAKPEDKSNNLAFDQKVLLSLSKILEGEDVCTAIMYDQDMQKLIVANNNANIDNYNAIIFENNLIIL